MELKKFISEALLNIVDGLDEANSKYINRFRILGVHHDRTSTEGAFAEFDIPVVVENISSGKAGNKIGANIPSVVSGNIGSEISENSSYQNAHRLKFKIFISETNKLA